MQTNILLRLLGLGLMSLILYIGYWPMSYQLVCEARDGYGLNNCVLKEKYFIIPIKDYQFNQIQKASVEVSQIRINKKTTYQLSLLNNLNEPFFLNIYFTQNESFNLLLTNLNTFINSGTALSYTIKKEYAFTDIVLELMSVFWVLVALQLIIYPNTIKNEQTQNNNKLAFFLIIFLAVSIISINFNKIFNSSRAEKEDLVGYSGGREVLLLPLENQPTLCHGAYSQRPQRNMNIEKKLNDICTSMHGGKISFLIINAKGS